MTKNLSLIRRIAMSNVPWSPLKYHPCTIILVNVWIFLRLFTITWKYWKFSCFGGKKWSFDKPRSKNGNQTFTQTQISLDNWKLCKIPHQKRFCRRNLFVCLLIRVFKFVQIKFEVTPKSQILALAKMAVFFKWPLATMKLSQAKDCQ